MELEHIKETKCPTCGASVCRDSVDIDHTGRKILVHTNGGRWEHRTFACGCRLSYVPNFGKVQETHPCHYHPEMKRKRTQREAARRQLVLFLDKLRKVDEDYVAGCEARLGFYLDCEDD